MHYAVAGCDGKTFEVLQILLEAKANVNQTDESQVSPVLLACVNNQLETVKLLSRFGADLSLASVPKIDPKDKANDKKFEKPIKDGKIEVESDTKSASLSALQFVVFSETHPSNTLVILQILDLAFNPVVPFGQAPPAPKPLETKLIKLLVKAGIGLEDVNEFGETPLIIAVKSGNEKTQKYFPAYYDDSLKQVVMKFTF